MKSDKASPEKDYLPIHDNPVDANRGRHSTSRRFVDDRWIRAANAFVVGVILYFILIILSNFYRHCCTAISENEAERVILSSPSPAYIRNQSYFYTSGAHLAGKNRTQATYTRDLWESYGIKTKIEEYEVLLNYPVSHRLALFDDDKVEYEAQLREDVIPEDPTSYNPDEVPTFHGYSAIGNVTGELVYANFGHINDFRTLEKNGVNVSGKVVIVRYGNTFRGLKVKAAQGRYVLIELTNQSSVLLASSFTPIPTKMDV
jgi:hypothetical protein